ncbi:MAG: ATP-binding protein [Oceanospirillaceae bacterium]
MNKQLKASLSLPNSVAPKLAVAEWVQGIIATFGLSVLTKPEPIFKELLVLSATSFCLKDITVEGHLQKLQSISFQQLQIEPALQKMIGDFDLQLWEFFVLVLVAETEHNFLINLALSQLQQPIDNPRVSAHLLQKVLTAFFLDQLIQPTIIDLVQHRLVTAKILKISNEEILAATNFSLAAEFWPLIMRNSYKESSQHRNDIKAADFTWLTAAESQSNLANEYQAALINDAFREQLANIIFLLQKGTTNVLVLRGDTNDAHNISLFIAQHLTRKLRYFDHQNLSSNNSPLLACHYFNYLPVIELQLASGEGYSIQQIKLAQRFSIPIIIILGSEGNVDLPSVIEVTLGAAPLMQRHAMWKQQLAAQSSETLDLLFLARSAFFSANTIQLIVHEAAINAQRHQRKLSLEDILYARYTMCGNKLAQLAQKVACKIDSSALVVPNKVEQQLQRLISRCLSRESLHQGLGNTAKTTASKGVKVLFYGESGTGKTLAASYLANALAAPLFRLDLASVMNKYIGETEKNLSAALDQAAVGDAILLFDEADSLFGKRTQGESSGDRFANMLTNYLLSRIENHPGIVILTSNARARIDSAFTRRLDAVIEFPIPEAKQRYQLWLKHLGSRAPADEFCQFLSCHSELAGGYIRNAVLNAAAIDQGVTGDAIDKEVLLSCLIDEYFKAGKAIPAQLQQYMQRVKRTKS